MKNFFSMRLLVFTIIFFSALFNYTNVCSLETIRIAGITNISPLEHESPLSGPHGLYVKLWKLWSEKTGITANELLNFGREGEDIDFVVRGNVAELFQESERCGINVFLADSVYAADFRSPQIQNSIFS